MPVLYSSTINPTIISKRLTDGATDQYLQAKLYDKGGNLRHTVNMDHVAGGTYAGEFINSGSETYLLANYAVYTDSARTSENTQYDLEEDSVVAFLMEPPLGGSVRSVNLKPLGDKLDALDKKISQLKLFDPKKDKVQLNEFKEIKQEIESNINSLQDDLGVRLDDQNQMLESLGNQVQAKNIAETEKIAKLFTQIFNNQNSFNEEQKEILSQFQEEMSRKYALIGNMEAILGSVLRLFASFLNEKANVEQMPFKELIEQINTQSGEIIKKFNQANITGNFAVIQGLIEAANANKK